MQAPGLAMGSYLRPTTVEEAVAALSAGPRTVIAGGTDFYPARLGRPISEDLLDITAIPALRGIADEPAAWRFGAATTWTDILECPLPPLFTGLKLAAREVGGRQIQNAGTIGGNLCNAAAAADGVPVWLSLDAEVELIGADGTTRLRVADFVLANRITARRPDQMLAAVIVPKPRHPARTTFRKLGARRYLVISIVMVAAAVELTDGEVSAARIAVGACAPTARRLPALEAVLLGRPCNRNLADAVAPEHLEPLAPIDDVRASAAYRTDAALTLIRRALADLGSPA